MMSKKYKRTFLVSSLILFFICLALLLFYQPSIKSDRPTVAIILGYNFFLKKDIGPKNYISRVGNILKSYKDLRYIIVTGANTLPSISEISEAKILSDELMLQGCKINIILEEQAKTTPENLYYCANILSEITPSLPANTEIIIFSDTFKRPRVWRYSDPIASRYAIRIFGISMWHEHHLSLKSRF